MATYEVPDRGTARFWIENVARADRLAHDLCRRGYRVEGPTLTTDRNGWRVSWSLRSDGRMTLSYRGAR
jgi:hypothetical protein